MQSRLRAPLTGTLLALLLVGMQTLALLHGVWHAPAGAGVASGTTPTAGAEPWFVDDHVQGSVVCHLLDQLGHANGTAPCAADAGIAPVATPVLAAPASQWLPCSACGYEARAPPLRA